MSVAMAVVVVLVLSCTSATEPPAPPVSSPQGSTIPPGSGTGGTRRPAPAPADLRVGLQAEPGSLDPISGPFDRSTYQVARALFDPLLAYDDRLDLQPVLAESVTPAEDLRTWTIQLRPGVRFSDGRPFDAGVVVRMLQRARTTPVFARDLDLVRDIEATDTHRVVVQLRAPWSTFPHVLAGQLGMVASARRAPLPTEGAPSDSTGGTAGTQVAAPGRSEAGDSVVGDLVGTGPFRMTEWEAGRSLRVARVDDYWRATPAASPGITFRFIDNPTARSAMVIDGELDVAFFDEPSGMADAEVAGARGAVSVHADKAGETPELVIALATDRPPFDERDARLALAQAIDRDALSRRVFNGQYPLAEGPFSEGSRWFGQAQWPVRDPNAAREALKRRAEPEKPLRFELLAESTPLNRRLVEELGYQLQEIGIELQPTWLARPELRARAADWRFTAALVPLLGGQHPDNDYAILHSRADGAGLRNVWIDGALEKARKVTDLTAQAEAFQVVQEQLAQELPFVFLVRLRNSIVTSPAVRDLEASTLPNGRPGLPQLNGTVSLDRVSVLR